MPSDLATVQQLLRQQRPAEAWAALETLLRQEPPSLEALLLAGRIQLALDQAPQARTYLTHAATLAPRSPAAHFLLGFCLYLDNDFTPALASLNTARQLRAADGPTLLYLALTHEGLADVEAALKLYPEAIRQNPSPEAPLAFARLLFTLHRLSEAHTQIKEALRRDPQYREAYSERARLHLEAGHFAEAVADAEHALTLPGLPQTERQLHFLLARAYQKLRNEPKARLHREAFERIPPRLVR